MRAGLLLLALAAWVQAEERFELPRRVVVLVEATPAATRAGGYGYVTVELTNGGRRDAQVVTLDLDAGDIEFHVRRSVVLEPGAMARVVLPLPGCQWGASLDMSVRGDPQNSIAYLAVAGGASGPSVLSVSDRPGRFAGWPEALAGLTGSHTFGSQIARKTAQLPGRWQLLTGFDLIVIDGSSGDLTAARQEVLARYVSGGGHLLLVGIEALRDGALRELMIGESGRRGLGSWFAMAAVRPGAASDKKRELRAWLLDGGKGPMTMMRAYSGPRPDAMYQALPIPGIGDVPVRLFFLLILAFAIAVGPVNYFWLKRRRRLGLLLVTVPAAGFGVTLLILVYGLFSEGFGIKGSVRSITVLDQRTHEAVSAMTRTLYAGIGPSFLTPAPGTYLFSASLVNDTQGYRRREHPSTHRLDVDLDRGGRIDGSLLPSRLPTPIYTLYQGRARERLRFRRLDGGGLELLYAPEFAPSEGAGTVLLRDFDGAYFVNRRDGRMERIDHPPSEQYDALRRGFRMLPDSDPGAANRGTISRWCNRMLLSDDNGRTMARGSYVARMKAAPATDTLGLDVEFLADYHLVRGMLAAEDFVE